MEEETLLLDTPVLVHLARDDAFSKQLDADLGLRQRRIRPFVSVVSVGELRSMALRNGWGEKKLNALNEALLELVIVPVDHGAICDRYGEFQVFSQGCGSAIGQNDLWIASAASVIGARLVTSDRDFDHLVPSRLSRTLVDANSGAVTSN